MNKKIKILYISPRFYPFKGGAEINMFAMASRMAKNGHDVSVLTTNFPFRNIQSAEFEEYEGIKIHRLWSIVQRPAYLCFTPMLLIKLLKTDADVIHMSGFGFIWFEYCLLIKKLFSRKTKFINTPHGPFMAFEDSESGIRGFSKKIYTAYLRFILPKLYNKVIAVVPKQNVWLKELYDFKDENIVVVPNGIDASYISNKKPEIDKSDKVTITFIGRMEYYKGIQEVIRALALLKTEKLPPHEFIAMGRPGPYVEKLKQLISEKELEDVVKLKFSPSDEEKDEILFEKSQISVLPSKWEGTGIVLIEAMAKGNAIVSTNQNEGVDMLITPESGFRYEFGDIQSLKEILKDLISDFDLRQKMIKNNLVFAKNFTWDSIFPNYEKIVTELVK